MSSSSRQHNNNIGKRATGGSSSILEGWKVWLLLTVVIQLALWVRFRFMMTPTTTTTTTNFSSYQYHRYSDDDDMITVSSDSNFSVPTTTNSNDDHCSGYKTCGDCTYSRFKSFTTYSALPTTTKRFNDDDDDDDQVVYLTGKSTCHWCSLTSTCYAPSAQPDGYCIDHHTKHSESVGYQYDCPLGPKPYPKAHPPSLLPNWMGEFYRAGILGNASDPKSSMDGVRLIDLSLPGTHDSLSYDLSLTVSEDGIDSLKELAKLLHTLSGGFVKILPGDLEEFFRMQAKTQQLTLTQQLDNGIRFIDLRIMYEPDKQSWYSIHFMQSKKPAEQYLREIRQWLDQHPLEVVVIWLSKHGSTTATGGNQYPGVSREQKQQFWKKYCTIFDGLMQPTSNETSIYTTPLATLMEKNHRVISFVSDYMEFTDNSNLANNAAFIQNTFDDGDGVFKTEHLVQTHIDYFKNASYNNHVVNKQHGFTLLGMNTASPGWQVIAAAKHQFLHWLQQRSLDHRNAANANAAGRAEEERVRRRRRRRHDKENGDNHHLLQHPQQSHNNNNKPTVGDTVRQMAMVSRSPLSEVVRELTRTVSSWIETSTQNTAKGFMDFQGNIFSSCPSHIKIPGMDHFCPKNLMDISQLSSYYCQIAIEVAYQHCFDDNGNTGNGDGDGDGHPTKQQQQQQQGRGVLAAFPNAFYMDGLDYDGTLRVGPQLLDGSQRGDTMHNVDTKDSKHAFVDTVLSYNARVACSKSSSATPDDADDGCNDLMDRLYERRSKHLLQLWNEPDMGRHNDWPKYSYYDDDDHDDSSHFHFHRHRKEKKLVGMKRESIF